MRMPKNIVQHELIGLRCRVTGAANTCSIGISGKIVDETMKTLLLETAGGKRKRVEKAGTKLRLWLPGHVVDVDGSKIVARPEDRIRKRLKRW